jgi:hypothetical protein
MKKSIDDILRQQAAQRQTEVERQQAEEKAIYERRERQRQEYLKNNRIYESLAAVSSAAAGAGGGSPFVEYISVIDTNWIYPKIDLQYVEETAPGLSPSIPFTRTGNVLSFPTLNDLVAFYEVVYLRTEVSQPVGNRGFSLGVGTVLRAKMNDRIIWKLDSGITVVEWVLMYQITSQSTLPSGGNSPDGTVGYGTIYCDWNLDGVQDATNLAAAISLLLDGIIFRPKNQ